MRVVCRAETRCQGVAHCSFMGHLEWDKWVGGPLIRLPLSGVGVEVGCPILDVPPSDEERDPGCMLKRKTYHTQPASQLAGATMNEHEDDTIRSTGGVAARVIAFVRAAIERLRPQLEAVPEYEEPLNMVPLTFQSSRYDTVVDRALLPLQPLDELQELATVLQRSRHVDGRMLYGLHRTLGAILATVLQFHGLQPTDEQILDIFNRLIEEYDTGISRYRVTAPLSHYAHPDPSATFSVGDGSTIEMWTRVDSILHKEINDTYLFPPTPSGTLTGAIVVPELPTSDPGTEITRAMESARRVIWAMRLVQSGDVAAPYFFIRAIGPSLNAGYGYMALTRFQDLEARRTGTDYLVGSDTMEQVNRIYAHLRSIKGTADTFKGLGFALRRFNLSYSRDYAEDRLIDLTSSLESALVPTQDVEIKYRLAWRTAILLAEVGEEPIRVRRHIQDIYDIRSAIVHGGKTIAEFDPDKLRSEDLKNDISTVPTLCEHYTRLVLKRCVERLSGRLSSIRALEGELDDKLAKAAATLVDVGKS